MAQAQDGGVPKVHADLDKKMKASLEAFRKDLNSIRTGRASLSILDSIIVPYYGVPTPLNQVATLSVPESRLITIQPWDSSVMSEVEKAILKSDLGLTPTSDGRVIKIPIPPLTEERRKQLVRLVKKLGEDCKVAVRNIRRDGNDELKILEKDKKISEDELRRAQDQVQKLTDRYIAMADQVSAQKEKEVMEV
jgi:ribosome recycling factor